MKQENKIIIREAVSEAGDYLKDKIKPTVEIPNRNSYAHVWKAIKTAMGHSYKECSDDDVVKILEVIKECRDDLEGLNP